MTTCEDISRFISRRPRIVRLLETVERLGIPDAWIGAGLIRNAVWDLLHDFDSDRIAVSDVDVAYFDARNSSVAREAALEGCLRSKMPDVPWEVQNQARMHNPNGDLPYQNTEDAIRCWPETATAIAARSAGGRIEVIASHGVEDLWQLIVRPTPHFRERWTSIASALL